jgi:hypothetical protein
MPFGLDSRRHVPTPRRVLDGITFIPVVNNTPSPRSGHRDRTTGRQGFSSDAAYWRYAIKAEYRRSHLDVDDCINEPTRADKASYTGFSLRRPGPRDSNDEDSTRSVYRSGHLDRYMATFRPRLASVPDRKRYPIPTPGSCRLFGAPGPELWVLCTTSDRPVGFMGLSGRS